MLELIFSITQFTQIRCTQFKSSSFYDSLCMALSRRAYVVLVVSMLVGLLFTTPQSQETTIFLRASAASQNDLTGTSYPEIQNFAVNVNQSESTTIFVPVDNLGSSLNWTDMRLTYVDSFSGIKISTDPLLFADSIVLSYSDNYSLRIGISIGSNTSFGVYTIPFTLTARSSFFQPSIATSANFNVTITVLKSPPRPFPLALLFPPFILIAVLTMIGIVIIWSKNWHISEVKK